MEEVVQEMTLDEWKNLQQRNRPKPEFNIRKPESTVPSKQCWILILEVFLTLAVDQEEHEVVVVVAEDLKRQDLDQK
ncbi:hypothetical protein DUI87_03675 [Hirundo rustica rustica]|uniref:Hyaluronan/mRNA-binding protein domain-containing protein n=1 Tax=Hirundo rustica rustica TaxID=333673 RepID=A0A3M0L250_HIRRU|nr:hypothetical protein DUI87_03675 [Hirundo rustica rustica]